MSHFRALIWTPNSPFSFFPNFWGHLDFSGARCHLLPANVGSCHILTEVIVICIQWGLVQMHGYVIDLLSNNEANSHNTEPCKSY